MDTAVDKAFIVLSALEKVSNGRSLAEVSADTGLPKPTVHRLLATMERHGYVQQFPSGRYALGMRIVALGMFAAGSSTLLSIARPILDRLVLACGETLHLGILQGESLLYVDRREPEDVTVRVATLPSPHTSLHASACGKVLLAFGDEDLARNVLAAGLTPYTAHTITDEAGLRDALAAIRADGYAVNEQERFVGVRAVGVPIWHRSGALIGALSAAGPVQRVDEDKLDELKVLLLKAAGEISQGLR